MDNKELQIDNWSHRILELGMRLDGYLSGGSHTDDCSELVEGWFIGIASGVYYPEILSKAMDIIPTIQKLLFKYAFDHSALRRSDKIAPCTVILPIQYGIWTCLARDWCRRIFLY